MSSPKIVGAGLNKTGTGTLKTCMQHWGLKHATYDLAAFKLYRRGEKEGLYELMDQYDSFENWPWALMYEDFDRRYADAKFILTIRRDAQTWFRSLCSHAKRMGPLVDFEQYIYGYANPCEHEGEHIEFYHRHNERVRAYFAGRPEKLLVLCWDAGDGWEELCAFLDRPVPDVPLPHANKTLTVREKLERRVRPRLGLVKRRLLNTAGRR